MTAQVTLSQLKCLYLNYWSNFNLVSSRSTNVCSMSVSDSCMFVAAGVIPHVNKYGKKGYDNLVNVQVCLRIHGKNDDLENIGKTREHTSLFHMGGVFYFDGLDVEKYIKRLFDFLKLIKLGDLHCTLHPNDSILEPLIAPFVVSVEYREDNIWKADGLMGTSFELFSDGIEVCNSVFVFRELSKRDSLEQYRMLDFGIGLDRVALILNKMSHSLETLSNNPNFRESVRGSDNFRVYVDAVRTAYEIMSSGVFPASKGRGNILRKMIKIAVLSEESNYLKLVEDSGIFQDFSYWGLLKKEMFLMSRQLKKLSSIKLDSKNPIAKLIREKKSDELYQTYGFSPDFVKKMLGVDIPPISNKETSAKKQKVCFTVDHEGESDFDYSKSEICSTVLKNSSDGVLTVDKNIFYPNAGGQCADHGFVEIGSSRFRCKGIAFNKISVIDGKFSVGDSIKLLVDWQGRSESTTSHTLHHIIMSCIKRVCPQSEQRSSIVNRNKILLTCGNWIGDDGVVDKLKGLILRECELAHKSLVEINNMNINDAMEDGYLCIKSGTDKYPLNVRCIKITTPTGVVSKEMCCGPHNLMLEVKDTVLNIWNGETVIKISAEFVFK